MYLQNINLRGFLNLLKVGELKLLFNLPHELEYEESLREGVALESLAGH